MKIDKNIPYPEPDSTGNYKGKYDFDLLAVTDSVLICDEKNHSIRCKIWHLNNTTQKKFITKIEQDGTRVWRVK